MGEGELCPFLCNITIIIIISKRTHEKTLVFSHALFAVNQKNYGIIMEESTEDDTQESTQDSTEVSA